MYLRSGVETPVACPLNEHEVVGEWKPNLKVRESNGHRSDHGNGGHAPNILVDVENPVNVTIGKKGIE